MDKFNELMDRLWEEDRDDYLAVQDITNIDDNGYDDDEWTNVYNSVGSLGKEAMDVFASYYAGAAIGGPWQH